MASKPTDPGTFPALAEYFQTTGSRLEGSVQGERPEAGSSLPTGPLPLKPGKFVIIADAFVECRVGWMPEEVDAAMAFLDALVRIYPLLPREEPDFYDWPAAARKTMRSLTSGKQCTRAIDGKLFVEAYVGSTCKPPESMVQGALKITTLPTGARAYGKGIARRGTFLRMRPEDWTSPGGGGRMRAVRRRFPRHDSPPFFVRPGGAVLGAGFASGLACPDAGDPAAPGSGPAPAFSIRGWRRLAAASGDLR